MDIRQLVYFTAVVEEGTVTAAAEKLHLSQPPLTAQIHLLEQELDCSLFDRSGRRLQLTDAGKVFYRRACGILDLCDSARSEMADLRQGGAGVLRVGAVSSVCSSSLPQWVARFGESGSRVRLEVYEANTYQLLEQVRARRIELAFVRTPFSAPDLSREALGREPLCAVGLPSLLPEETGANLSTLAQVPLLLYRRWEHILSDAFAEQGLRPRVLCVSDDARTVEAMARAGLGVGIVPGTARPEAGLVRRPLADFQTELCAVRRRDSYISAAADRFLEAVRKCRTEIFSL